MHYRVLNVHRFGRKGVGGIFLSTYIFPEQLLDAGSRELGEVKGVVIFGPKDDRRGSTAELHTGQDKEETIESLLPDIHLEEV